MKNVHDSKLADCVIRDDRAARKETPSLAVTGGGGNLIVNNCWPTATTSPRTAARLSVTMGHGDAHSLLCPCNQRATVCHGPALGRARLGSFRARRPRFLSAGSITIDSSTGGKRSVGPPRPLTAPFARPLIQLFRHSSIFLSTSPRDFERSCLMLCDGKNGSPGKPRHYEKPGTAGWAYPWPGLWHQRLRCCWTG
jgi:hypothetical protein